MPRKPNYEFERRERARLKAAKNAEKAAAKKEARERAKAETVRHRTSSIPAKRPDSGRPRAATAGHGIEPHLARSKADHDDDSDIMLALADRFANGCTSGCGKTIWSYAPNNALSNEVLVRGRGLPIEQARSTSARTVGIETHIPPHSYGEVPPSYGGGGVRSPRIVAAHDPSVGVRRRHLPI